MALKQFIIFFLLLNGPVPQNTSFSNVFISQVRVGSTNRANENVVLIPSLKDNIRIGVKIEQVFKPFSSIKRLLKKSAVTETEYKVEFFILNESLLINNLSESVLPDNYIGSNSLSVVVSVTAKMNEKLSNFLSSKAIYYLSQYGDQQFVIMSKIGNKESYFQFQDMKIVKARSKKICLDASARISHFRLDHKCAFSRRLKRTKSLINF